MTHNPVFNQSWLNLLCISWASWYTYLPSLVIEQQCWQMLPNCPMFGRSFCTWLIREMFVRIHRFQSILTKLAVHQLSSLTHTCAKFGQVSFKNNVVYCWPSEPGSIQVFLTILFCPFNVVHVSLECPFNSVAYCCSVFGMTFWLCWNKLFLICL